MDISNVQNEGNQELQVLVLVGLPGSGKSCLATALEQTGRWVRASQDDAPNRRRQEAEAMTRRALQFQRNAVIDRVGFDRKQRSHFIEIAREYPNVRCTCVILDVKRETLEARLAARTGHPTLVDIDIAMRVLSQMNKDYKPPRREEPEGYSRVYVLPESEQPPGGVWTEAHLDKVLHKLEESSWRDEPYVPPPPRITPYPAQQGFSQAATSQHSHHQYPNDQRSDRGHSWRGRGYNRQHDMHVRAPRPDRQGFSTGTFSDGFQNQRRPPSHRQWDNRSMWATPRSGMPDLAPSFDGGNALPSTLSPGVPPHQGGGHRRPPLGPPGWEASGSIRAYGTDGASCEGGRGRGAYRSRGERGVFRTRHNRPADGRDGENSAFGNALTEGDGVDVGTPRHILPSQATHNIRRTFA